MASWTNGTDCSLGRRFVNQKKELRRAMHSSMHNITVMITETNLESVNSLPLRIEIIHQMHIASIRSE